MGAGTGAGDLPGHLPGVLAVGSIVWGLVAERVGEPSTPVGAAGCMQVGTVISGGWRLEASEHLDLSPSYHLPDPVVHLHLSNLALLLGGEITAIDHHRLGRR